jgi:DDE superfamily endonuclease
MGVPAAFGTTTLFAALDVATGKVIGRCMKRHRHQEWRKLLRRIDAETLPHLDVHLIADNYATHKHAKVKAWFKRHPRFHMHFTPTSSSWLNQVERFFDLITGTASVAACSRASPNSKPPSRNTSISTTPIQRPSPGPNLPPPSSRKWTEGDKR